MFKIFVHSGQVFLTGIEITPHMGPSTYDVRFFQGFFDLPTYVRFCPIEWVLFYLVVSDFRKPTYLPKNRTSYVDPLSGFFLDLLLSGFNVN